jgi:hypothetical protein
MKPFSQIKRYASYMQIIQKYFQKQGHGQMKKNHINMMVTLEQARGNRQEHSYTYRYLYYQ